jgi:type III secretion system low calcium response chaperone LcrH/SycD
MMNDSSIPNLSRKKISEIHATAYHLYRHGHYQDAATFFRFLVMFQPNDAKFWTGLGASMQMQNDYQEALHCYQYAISIEGQQNCLLHAYAADCYFALDIIGAGLNSLNICEKEAKKSGHQSALSHVAFMKQRWQQKGKKNERTSKN